MNATPINRTLINIRLVVLTLVTATLAACASLPVPLRGEFTAITPRDATDRDSTGAMVRWGGRIVEVEPQPDRTCFEMLSTQLNSYGRPYWASDDIGGRFIACRTGFYDPALFQEDREVSFTGRIEGYENRRVGEYDYRFPRLTADVVYLWPVRERVNVIERPAPWGWGGPGWGPRWGWW